MLTSGDPEAPKFNVCMGLEIVQVCMVEVGYAVLGVVCLEILRAKQLAMDGRQQVAILASLLNESHV